MKTKNLIWMSALLLSAVSIGCQRQSNPVRNYSVAQDQGLKYSPGNKASKPEQPDNRQFVCYEPLTVTVTGDSGHQLLKFVEGQARTYQVKVGYTMDKSNGQFDVKADRGDVALKPVSRSSNLVTYNLTWTPGRVKSSDGADNFIIKLRLVNAANTLCGTDISAPLNFLVVRTADNPTISFQDLPPGPMNIGDKAQFKIKIYDPASTQELAPDLKNISFPASLRNGERQILNAVPGLSCGETGQPLGEAQFLFSCVFDSSRVDVKSIKDEKLETIEAKFAVEAVSKRNRKTSGLVTAGFTLKLPKKESIPEPTFGPAPEQAAPVASAPTAEAAAPVVTEPSASKEEAPKTEPKKVAKPKKKATATKAKPAAKGKGAKS